MNKLISVPIIRWVAFGLFVFTLLMNYLSQGILFEGKTIGTVSDKYSTLITPAGYAFAIWGLIYLMVGAYIYYQTFQAEPEEPFYDRIAFPLILNFIANSGWLVIFQLEQIALSSILMVTILVTLIQVVILWTNDHSLPEKQRLLMRIPFSIYLGWISVATIVNFSLMAKYTGWDVPGVSESNWVVIMTSVGAALAIMVLFATRNLVYPLVFVWAYVAIAVAQPDNQLIFTAALGWAAIILISDLVCFILWRKSKQALA
ncbi:tryptophan-rich sensory protein [Tunicatimonas pelagia]|uniref:tryptophan-rich sensory protein n=1 Tax=Tunicatimonas pelagia TaxID=931531 RepID=UPI00266554A2|nr:tryptophan-rich sensory protein [Tunicatimonas pelagia]WKN46270.1 tryptophan-rich sensory protein [Tunicatimonas pelagia]